MSTIKVFNKQVKQLQPVYFALVMATGIVSIACQLLGFGWLSGFLFYLNNLNYGVLLVLFTARMVLFPQTLMANLSDSS